LALSRDRASNIGCTAANRAIACRSTLSLKRVEASLNNATAPAWSSPAARCDCSLHHGPVAATAARSLPAMVVWLRVSPTAMNGYRRIVGLKSIVSGTSPYTPATTCWPVVPGMQSPNRPRMSTERAPRP
jgi:hypothetical protein